MRHSTDTPFPAVRLARRPRRFRPGLLALAIAAACGASRAQIVTDGSVGAAVRLNPVLSRIEIPKALGLQSGGNLFHSFRSFNIAAGETAAFDATGGIANVISRVTGGDPSLIFGRLQVTAETGATPGFYFVNPAGVLFGTGSSIDVPGAFHLATADAVTFAGGGRFHADPSKASTFSAAAPEAFGFLGASRAPVIIDGARLVTRAGQALSVTAGDLTIDGGSVVGASGGSIRLAAVGQVAADLPVAAPLPAAAGRLVLDGGSRVVAVDGGTGGVSVAGGIGLAGGTVTLAGGAYVYSESGDTGTGGAGAIDVRATGALTMADGASISSGTFGDQAGASLRVEAGTLAMSGGSYLYASSGPGVAGRVGAIDVRVGGAASLTGGANVSTFVDGSGGSDGVRFQASQLTMSGSSYVQTGSTGSGSAGPLRIEVANAVVLGDHSRLTTGSAGAAPAGDLSLTAGSLSVAGESEVGSVTGSEDGRGTGRAGNLDLAVRGDVVVGGNSRIWSRAFTTGGPGSVQLTAGNLTLDFSSISSNALGLAGASGRIGVTVTGALRLLNDSSIDSGTLSSGAAGAIRAQASTITLDGASYIGSSALAGTGAAGAVELVASGRVELLGGSDLRSTTATSGAGGRISVDAAALLLDGASSINALTGGRSSGHGGDVLLRTSGELTMRGGSTIVALTGGRGDAGRIQLDVGSLVMDSTGTSDRLRTNINSVAAEGSAGHAGRIDVNAASSISLTNSAFISSGTLSSGSGGVIQLTARDLTIGTGAFVTSTADVGSTGNAGQVSVRLGGALKVETGGTIVSTTDGAGSAGAVSVEAATVLLTGRGSGIYAGAAQDSSGQVGSVDVRASESLRVVDGAAVSIENFAIVRDARPRTPTAITLAAPTVTIATAGRVSASSTGNVAASDIAITARDRVELDLGDVTTSAVNGDGGDIRIASGGRLDLRRSVVQTSVFGVTGSGGDIDIVTPILLLDTGFIQANTAAANASGGLVRVAADALVASGNNLYLGGNAVLTPADLFGFNVIQAAAPTGVSGVVDLTSPVLDLTGSLRVLRADVVDTGGLGRSLCQTTAGSSLALGGRGGLPASSRSWQRAEPASPSAPTRAAADGGWTLGALRVRGCL